MRWNKKIYIAKKKELGRDDYGNQIKIFEEPILYSFNVQPVSSEEDLMAFGEKANMIQKAVIPIRFVDYFKEGDVAYLDGATPEGEVKNGDNANYRLYPPRNQNKRITIYFERKTGK